MINYSEVVECLVCSEVFGEYEKLISTCPHCGNDDMQQTIYLCEDSIIRSEFLKGGGKLMSKTIEQLRKEGGFKPMENKNGYAWFGGKNHNGLSMFIDKKDAENFEDLDFLVVGYVNNSTEEDDD
tara:strand:- start:678 stop:1052 length:375 start_codon:yes stop_codon:yes gene_type:complete